MIHHQIVVFTMQRITRAKRPYQSHIHIKSSFFIPCFRTLSGLSVLRVEKMAGVGSGARMLLLVEDGWGSRAKSERWAVL